MMLEPGLKLYQHLLTHSAQYKHLPFLHKTKLTKILQLALSSKRAMEYDTIAVVKHLQSQGTPVFALTAAIFTYGCYNEKGISTNWIRI